MFQQIRSEIGRFALRGSLVLVLGALIGGGTASAADLDTIVAQRMAVNDAGVKSQTRIDAISADTDQATAEYRTVLQRIDALRSYNHQVNQLIHSQDVEIISLRRQIDDVELVGREVTPLMVAMVDSLENFVELDVPFLKDERVGRVANLRELLVRSDVSSSERYRRIVEAYQIENDFGRTIEAYQGPLEGSDKPRRVEFLRIGRVTLLYQTLDGLETGVWDQRNRVWVDAGDYGKAVRTGIKMARKQTAPDLLRLPLPTAEAVR